MNGGYLHKIKSTDLSSWYNIKKNCRIFYQVNGFLMDEGMYIREFVNCYTALDIFFTVFSTLNHLWIHIWLYSLSRQLYIFNCYTKTWWSCQGIMAHTCPKPPILNIKHCGTDTTDTSNHATWFEKLCNYMADNKIPMTL